MIINKYLHEISNICRDFSVWTEVVDQLADSITSYQYYRVKEFFLFTDILTVK